MTPGLGPLQPHGAPGQSCWLWILQLQMLQPFEILPPSFSPSSLCNSGFQIKGLKTKGTSFLTRVSVKCVFQCHRKKSFLDPQFSFSTTRWQQHHSKVLAGPGTSRWPRGLLCHPHTIIVFPEPSRSQNSEPKRPNSGSRELEPPWSPAVPTPTPRAHSQYSLPGLLPVGIGDVYHCRLALCVH